MEATRADPVGWCEDNLGIRYSSQQRQLLEAVRDCEAVAGPAANSTGKTHATASIACWYLASHYPAKVILTSASWRNIERQNWPKLRAIREAAPLKDLREGDWYNGDLKWIWDRRTEHGIYCISPDKPEVAGGYHAPGGILFIVDEASGLDARMEQAIDGCMASGNATILLIGNPIHETGPFADAIREAEANKSQGLWRLVRMSAFDTPNVTGEEPPIPGLATPEWIDRMERKYGKGSAFWAARVLGQIPAEDEYQLIHLAWIASAMQRPRPTSDDLANFPITAGVDIARSAAGDLTVVIARRGPLVFPPRAWHEPDLMVNADHILTTCFELGVRDARHVKIDDVGIGGGVTNRLHQKGYPVIPVTFGASAGDKDRFANQRAEAYWALREFIKHHAVLPDERDGNAHVERLRDDLMAQRLDSGQRQDPRIKLEAKETIKTRLGGRSPDYGDALAMSVYDPPCEVVDIWDAHDEYYGETAIVPGLD